MAALLGGMACGGPADDGPAPPVCSLETGRCVRPVRAVAAGTGHTCALHDDGAVSCWGYGPFIAPGLAGLTGPVPVALGGPATAVAVGIQAACALTAGGRARCWGDFGAGAEAPWEVQREGGGALAGLTRLAGGSVAFCGLDRAGAAFCWGDNKASELARPTGTVVPARTAVLAHPGPARQLAATVAILIHDGTQLCGWGNNDSGLAPGSRGIVDRPGCGPLPDVLGLTAGDGHACAHRGGDRFSCWGSNSGGQLGSGDEDALEAELPGTTVTLPGNIVALAAGAYHTCALVQGGQAHCWGNNDHGEVGVPASVAHFRPRPVPGGQGFVAIGAGAGATHTCGILGDGGVRCWGYDDRGQLGAGFTREDSDRWSAMPVSVRW